MIVANERGSSAQIIENEGYSSPEKLFFNKNGEKCSFLGQRLSEHRIEEGREHVRVIRFCKTNPLVGLRKAHVCRRKTKKYDLDYSSSVESEQAIRPPSFTKHVFRIPADGLHG